MGLSPLRAREHLRVTDDAVFVQTRPKWSENFGNCTSATCEASHKIFDRLDMLCQSIEELLGSAKKDVAIKSPRSTSQRDSLARTFELDNVLPECFTDSADSGNVSNSKWRFRLSSL